MRIEDRPKKRMGVGKKMAYIITACVFMATMAILAIVKTTTEAEAMEAKIYESLQIQKEDVPEPVVVEEEEPEEPEEQGADIVVLTEDERLLMAKVVMAESGNQAFVGQVAVAATILNRSELREISIFDVVYETNQYASPWVGTITTEVMEAVDYACEHRDLFPKNMFFFKKYGFHTNKYAKDYVQIGEHYFSTDIRYEEEKVNG